MMEEVDNIILQALHQLGISFSDEVNTLSEFPEELVLLSVKKCLNVISNESDNVQIPEDMSQKIVMANDVVTQSKKLGFKGDLGYEVVLYPNEVDLRKLFSFLIDKLPKESDKAFVPRDNISSIMHTIGQTIAEDLQKPWIPKHCGTKHLANIGGHQISLCKYSVPFSQEPFVKTKFTEKFLEELSHLWKSEKNLIVRNDITPEMETEAEYILDKLKQSKTKTSSLKMTKLIVSDSESQVGSNINPSLLSMKELTNTIRQMEEEKEQMINKIKAIHSTKDELSTEIEKEKAKQDVLKEQKESHDIVISLLPEYETNLKKLSNIKEKESVKVKNIKNEIEILDAEAEKEKEVSEEFKAQHLKFANEIAYLETKKRDLLEDLRKQSALKAQLKRDCEKRNVKKKYIKKRSAYTKRIMEIIGNVAKQKVEINKILSDTRTLQKDMNNLNGRLDRSFTVVDELVFKDAKKDEHARKTYKLIAYIHTSCGEIVNNVNDVGSYLREIRDLEKRVEMEKKKKVEENLQRVYADLKYLQSKKEKHKD